MTAFHPNQLVRTIGGHPAHADRIGVVCRVTSPLRTLAVTPPEPTLLKAGDDVYELDLPAPPGRVVVAKPEWLEPVEEATEAPSDAVARDVLRLLGSVPSPGEAGS